MISPILFSAKLGIAKAIITVSTLSFPEFGFPPDLPTWGQLLKDGTTDLHQSFERVIWRGLAISLTVLSANYLSDGLRVTLDTRIKG